ncbi:RNA recognition motif domain-containing protein [Marinicellulosiphila megalodicopiae]|uniref:RNA recognition motif domain-containing protein n=1 Tax=Marinicellulosiphila megalodicopiae TaxID=2724896 RepID=UPI003BAE603B
MKLLVRNLDRATTKEELMDLFQDCGSVQSCDLVTDQATGESKGFGFVEMPKNIEAKTAIKNLNNKLVGKNRIRVKVAENKSA